jgi:CRISPR/Cas system endoribonuclease Cas6 (RAMP superfamily)
LIFGNLLRKWRLFFDSSAWPSLDDLLTEIEVLHYKAESRAVMMRYDRIFRGFVGNAEFVTVKKLSEYKTAIAALAGLSFFSGVGYKVVQGMGHTVPYFRIPGEL